jgi:hypothetical protein
MRDDDLCGSSSSDDDGGVPSCSTRTGKAVSGVRGLGGPEEEDWRGLWSDSCAPVDIGMVEEPEDLKFVDTPFTKARRNVRPLSEKMSDGGKGGKEKKVHSFPFLPIFSRTLFPFPQTALNRSKPTPAREPTKQTCHAPSSLSSILSRPLSLQLNLLLFLLLHVEISTARSYTTSPAPLLPISPMLPLR